jgi:flagellar capping protein FliD
MFQDVQLSGGGSLNLVSLGIRTHSDLARFGELQIDEERLEAFLTERADDVMEVFTNFSDISGSGADANRPARLREAGLGQRIHDIIQWELSFGGGLHDRVGATSGEGASVENSAMSRRIVQEDARIDRLLLDLQRREQRYFVTFGRLESAMIQANSQMMFLEQLFWMG